MFHKNGLLALAEPVVWKKKQRESSREIIEMHSSLRSVTLTHHEWISETSLAAKGRRLRDDSVGHVVVVVETVREAVVIDRRSEAVERRL